MDSLEEEGYTVVGDEHEDSVLFTAVAFELHKTHRVKSKYWNQSRPTLNPSSLLEQCGARATSQDVHWHLTISLMNRRTNPSVRYRSTEGHMRRNWKTGPEVGFHWHTLQTKKGRSIGSVALRQQQLGGCEQHTRLAQLGLVAELERPALAAVEPEGLG